MPFLGLRELYMSDASYAAGLGVPEIGRTRSSTTRTDTGLGFLNAKLAVKRSNAVGDMIHGECEGIEHRLTSKGDRGLVRFANKVVNQRGETVLEYNPLRMLRRREA